MFNFNLLMLIPLSVLVILEWIYRGSFSSVYTWAKEFPKQFSASYLLIFAIINVFFILPRRFYMALGVLFLGLISILGYISRQKLNLRGEPLLPWDLSLRNEALSITKHFSILTIVAVIVLAILFVLIFLAVIKFAPKERYRWTRKIIAVAISLVILFTFVENFGSVEKTFSLRQINWSQKMNYDENGMALGFALNSRYLSVAKPEDYNEETIKLIEERIKPVAGDPDFKPNIIFVMSEAFWDPTLLKEVSFAKDPIPYFHYLQKTQTSGWMLSPVYGGGTANTEFEVLTGFSTQFLPGGVTAYVQYVHKPIEALPTSLKRQGYAATAIHTYDDWFYRRNTVYQELGFDRFISKEFFTDPEYKGSYIRDTELTKKILQGIKRTEKPDFVFAVSMEAHGPYSTEKDPQNNIKLKGNLTPESKAILENYTQTVSDVDQSLKQLIEGVEQLKEPTIVVFFGDHLPMLGNNYEVYKEANFFQDESSYQDYLQVHSVPFVVWDNFTTVKDKPRLSANFLGSYILERSKKAGSPLTDFLYRLRQKGSNAIVSEQFMGNEKILPEELNSYRLLQYDLLFGEEYALKLRPDHKPEANNDYVLGEGKVVIENVSLSNQATIEIKGQNFAYNHKVYVNGEAIESKFVDSSTITAQLPQNPKGTLAITLKLTDSMDNVISTSNTFELKVP